MVATKKAVARKASAKKILAKRTASKSTTPIGDKKASTPRGRAQDRRLVAGQQKHEVAYEAGKTGVSRGIVEEVVKAVGNARKKVEAAIQEFVGVRKNPARRGKK